MAKIYGERSRYLISLDGINYIAAFVYSILLFVIWYIVFIRGFNTISSSFVGLPVLLILFGPLFWFVYKQAEKHKRESNNYYHGRKGEYAIFYELKKLSDDYLVFQDIKIPNGKGNIDFVVLGPTGIFTIEAKSHRGRITFNGKDLLINNNQFEKNVLEQAMLQSLDLHHFILGKSNEDYFINSILVFSNKYANMKFGIKPIKNVCVVQKGFLRKAILEKPFIFSTEDIVKIEKILLSLNKKEYCEKLYNRYKELRGKTEMQANNKQLGEKCNPKYISAKDMEEIEKVEKELEKCLDYLSDNQLIELYSDDRFSYKATEIIAERKTEKLKIN